MKTSIVLLSMLLIACSDSGQGDVEDAGSGRIGLPGIEDVVEDEGSSALPNEGEMYGCAKVYLQIPYDTRNLDTGEISVTLSHQLWSVPVRKSIISNENIWYAVSTDFNTQVPTANNVDFLEEEKAYAIIILEDQTVIYDQLVIPAQGNTWQVCETLYCDQSGCQEHEEFNSMRWSCSLTQNRISDLSKCPCIFNSSGYPFCDVHYGEEE